MKLIAIHGRARSGKDTLAKLLMKHEPFIRMAFADPLKQAVAGLFNIPQSTAFSDDKNQMLDYWGLTLRDVLQRFGTEAMRGTFGQQFWIERWLCEYNGYKVKDANVVITDCRFENEAQAVKQMGGYVVQLSRDVEGLQGVESQHISERRLPKQFIDFYIDNNSGFFELELQAQLMLSKINGTK